MRFGIVPAGLFLVVAAAGVGCGPSPVKFNNAIAEANKRIEAGGEKFGKAIGVCIGKTDADPARTAEVKSTLAECRKIIADVRADMAGLKVPDSNEARALYDSHQSFLAGQAKMADEQFGKLAELAEKNTLTQFHAEKIFKELSAAENVALADLQAKQREFAKRYNIRLQ